MSTSRIRWSTNLISFFNTEYWGLGRNLSHAEWVSAFDMSPHDYFERMLDEVGALGFEGVELAPEPADFGRVLAAYGGVDGFRRALEHRGLELSGGYAPGRGLIGKAMADPAAEAAADAYVDEHSRFLAQLGASVMVMGNILRAIVPIDPQGMVLAVEDFDAPVPRDTHERFAAQLNRLAGISGRHGVVLAIHTDAYSVCSREEDIATVLELTDPDYVMICPDAGHIVLDGGDPVAVLRQHLSRIPTMHWKDCAGRLPGSALGDVPLPRRHAEMLKHFRVLGSGIVDWKTWMDVLTEARWAGWATEEIDHSPAPADELAQGLRYYREILAPEVT